MYGQELGNYDFCDSKDNVYIQISDLTVGILRVWLSFLESCAPEDIIISLTNLPPEARKTVKQFQQILNNSLEESIGFKHGVASNSFERKITLFLNCIL